MIRQYPHDNGFGDVVPQAIFWRPLPYFTPRIKNDIDDLDEYIFATFEIGNNLRFDLRNYAGHPRYTVTLYLDLSLDDPTEIQDAIALAVDGFKLPKFAIAWRRGQDFHFGQLRRSNDDRLKEPEARLIALKAAAQTPDRNVTVERIIERAVKFFQPSAVDLRPSNTRPQQPHWHQIIRNVISHRTGSQSIFAQGLARRTSNGLIMTKKGERYLQSIGFSAEL